MENLSKSRLNVATMRPGEILVTSAVVTSAAADIELHSGVVSLPWWDGDYRRCDRMGSNHLVINSTAWLTHE
ncbi:MAG: hypothetical protein F6J95_009675 [Leptolyngbya sp. SIO1E4]|nr:hypothetical protein [Leptolyngbya sp. SIO1E4]